MERRNFLKSLGILGAAIAIKPQEIIPPDPSGIQAIKAKLAEERTRVTPRYNNRVARFGGLYLGNQLLAAFTEPPSLEYKSDSLDVTSWNDPFKRYIQGKMRGEISGKTVVNGVDLDTVFNHTDALDFILIREYDPIKYSGKCYITDALVVYPGREVEIRAETSGEILAIVQPG